MSIIISESARQFRIAAEEGIEASATFTLTLTERDTAHFHDMFFDWAERRSGQYARLHWENRNHPFTGKKTMIRMFRWVEVKGVRSFHELQRELQKQGTIPSAAWCVVICRMPREQRSFPCGVADTSLSPYTNKAKIFPCVYVNGTVDFLPATDGDYTNWRWLVEI